MALCECFSLMIFTALFAKHRRSMTRTQEVSNLLISDVVLLNARVLFKAVVVLLQVSLLFARTSAIISRPTTVRIVKALVLATVSTVFAAIMRFGVLAIKEGKLSTPPYLHLGAGLCFMLMDIVYCGLFVRYVRNVNNNIGSGATLEIKTIAVYGQWITATAALAIAASFVANLPVVAEHDWAGFCTVVLATIFRYLVVVWWFMLKRKLDDLAKPLTQPVIPPVIASTTLPLSSV